MSDLDVRKVSVGVCIDDEGMKRVDQTWLLLKRLQGHKRYTYIHRIGIGIGTYPCMISLLPY